MKGSAAISSLCLHGNTSVIHMLVSPCIYLSIYAIFPQIDQVMESSFLDSVFMLHAHACKQLQADFETMHLQLDCHLLGQSLPELYPSVLAESGWWCLHIGILQWPYVLAGT